MTSATTIVAINPATTGQMECVMYTMLVNHSTFRMLQVYIFLEIWVGFLQLHVFVACGVVNKFYGQQVIATDVFLKVFILDLQTVCGYSYICIYVNYENVFKW